MTKKRIGWLGVAVLALGLVGYLAAMLRNDWVHKMGGYGIGEMAREARPPQCTSLVDLHHGGGNTRAAGDQMRLGPRTFVLDIRLLREHPECLGHSVLATAGLGPQADYRLIFVDANGTRVLEVTANYLLEDRK